MAEFQTVIQEAARICREHAGCGNCPLREMVNMADIYCPIPNVRKLNAAKVEAAVMDWAAEHPEPRYPSWHEAWKQLFPDGQGSPCPSAYGMRYEPEWCGSDDCKRCKYRPIPADIAEKLGIKPIWGSENG